MSVPYPVIQAHTVLKFDDGTTFEFESYVPEIRFSVNNDIALSHHLTMMVNPKAEFKVTLTDEGKKALSNKIIEIYNRGKFAQFWIDIKNAWRKLVNA